MTTIFAGGVLSSLSDETVLEYFSAYGRLHGFRRVFNKDRSESGYAFFEIDREQAEAIVAEPHVIKNALINCKIAADSSKISVSQKDEMERKLYVSNLPPSTSDLDLLYLFGSFGKLAKAYLVRNRADGNCKNFGFVIFQRRGDLERLLQEAPVIRFRNRKVAIKKAVDRQTQKLKRNSQPTPQVVVARRQPSEELLGSTKCQLLKRAKQLNQAESNYSFNYPDFRREVSRPEPGLESQTNTCQSLGHNFFIASTTSRCPISLHN